MASSKISIRTTQRDLRNDFTSTEHGKVHFDDRGVAEVDPEVAAYLLQFAHFVDHEDSAKDAGILPSAAPVAGNTHWSVQEDHQNHESEPQAPLTIKDVAKLAEMFDCELKPKSEPDWEVTFTDDEIVALAQSRGLVLASQEAIEAEVKAKVKAAIDQVKKDAEAKVKAEQAKAAKAAEAQQTAATEDK